jgi:hypothetical protein
MIRTSKIFCLTFALSLNGIAHAQTPWPEYMSRLTPARSLSPVAAPLPADITIEQPAPNVDDDKIRWLGIWKGWACQNQRCDTRLAVERVNEKTATITYSFAANGIGPYVERAEAKFNGAELQASLSGGAKIYYRIRDSGDLEFFFQQDKVAMGGVLSKQK